MKSVTNYLFISAIAICLLSIYLIFDLDRKIDRISSATMDYKSQLEKASESFESIEGRGDLHDLLIRCDRFDVKNAPAAGSLEITAFEMQASACNSAVAINKGVLAILVSSQSLAASLETSALHLELYLTILIIVAALVPGAIVVCFLAFATKKLQVLPMK